MEETSNENIKLEIENLEKQLQEKKLALEKGGETKKIESEITKENLKEAEQANVQKQIQAKALPAQTDEESEITSDVKKIKNFDTARQVKVLTILAFEKGILYSIKVARALNNAYLLDELHDKLVGELHDELVKKKKLKEL